MPNFEKDRFQDIAGQPAQPKSRLLVQRDCVYIVKSKAIEQDARSPTCIHMAMHSITRMRVRAHVHTHNQAVTSPEFVEKMG